MQNIFTFLTSRVHRFVPLLVLLGAIFLVNSLYAAWSPPETSPVSDVAGTNVPELLNVGSSAQTKTGILGATAFIALKVTSSEFCLSADGCRSSWSPNAGGPLVLKDFTNPMSQIINAQGIQCWDSSGTYTVNCQDAVHYAEETMNRLCQEAGYDFYVIYNHGSFTSPGNNYVIKWNESAGQWRREPADWSGNNNRVDEIRCISY